MPQKHHDKAAQHNEEAAKHNKTASKHASEGNHEKQLTKHRLRRDISKKQMSIPERPQPSMLKRQAP
jgi:hypothetical protein